jgi:hypothetical protein
MRHSPYGPFRVGGGSVSFGIQNDREWLVFSRLLPARGASIDEGLPA